MKYTVILILLYTLMLFMQFYLHLIHNYVQFLTCTVIIVKPSDPVHQPNKKTAFPQSIAETPF